MNPEEGMQAAQTGYSLGQDRSWEFEINLSAAGFSEWVIIPEKIKGISVTASFTGGASGKVQTSTDPVAVVKTGSPIAIDWPFGEVDINMSKSCRPVSGMRAVQIGTGTMKLTLRAQ